MTPQAKWSYPLLPDFTQQQDSTLSGNFTRVSSNGKLKKKKNGPTQKQEALTEPESLAWQTMHYYMYLNK